MKSEKTNNGLPDQRIRKAYSSPELVEWGSLLDLTSGSKSGTKDFPLKGGSIGV
jgi:hypothetical protein